MARPFGASGGKGKRGFPQSERSGESWMKNRSDLLGSGALFLVGAGAVIGGIQLEVGSPTEPQPGFFPLLSGISLMVFSGVIFLQERMKPGRKKGPPGEIWRPAMLVAVMVALVGILDLAGYAIGTFIASVVILRILRVKSWRVLLLASLCLSVGTYVLFDKLLGVELPAGMLARFGF